MERLSSIKNKQVIPSQNVWLIVFPLEIEFTATVDYPTVLYFEKNYQIIGDIRTPLPPSQKGQRHMFSSPSQMISFKLFSRDNLTYKWTLYRKYDSGQQEFIEDSSVDLKPFLGDLFVTSRSSLFASTESISLAACTQKQLWATFSSNGMKIRFMFYATDDLNTVEKMIAKRISSLREETPGQVEEPISSQAPLPVQNPSSSEANIDVSSKVEAGEHSKDILSNPQTQLISVPEEAATATQDKKEAKDKDQVVTVLQQAKPQPMEVQVEQQSNLMRIASIEKVTSFKEEELLRMESLQAKKTPQENDKQQQQQNLQVINEQPQKLPSSSASNPLPSESIQPEKVTEVDSKKETAQPIQTANSILDMKIDLKKAIILILLVIIGMLIPQRTHDKTAPKKKSKSKKR